MHLPDDSGLSSSDSEVDARDKDTLERKSVKTDVIKKTETCENNRDSNPFEDSDNDDEDTVLDHINLSGESETSDSKSAEEKVEKESIIEDSPQDESIGIDGEQTDAHYNGKSRSRDESGERKDGEGGSCDDNTHKDTKDILEAEETEDCKNTWQDTAGPVLQIDTCDEEETKLVKQPDISEEVSVSCEVSDILSNENVSVSSESVTVKESDEPKEAANHGQAENSGTYDNFFN